MFKKICQGRFLKRCAAVVVEFTLPFCCELRVSNEAENRKAGRCPPATKGHNNLSNLSNKQKKATLKI